MSGGRGSVTTAESAVWEKRVFVRDGLLPLFYSLLNDFTFTSAHPFTLHRVYNPPAPTLLSTDSEANKPQSRGKMKVNIFMNGFFFFFPPPVSAETPEVYKNNGVCNIIPSTVNRSCLKEGFWRRVVGVGGSSIKRLFSSTRRRKSKCGGARGGGGACDADSYLRLETRSQV